MIYLVLQICLVYPVRQLITALFTLVIIVAGQTVFDSFDGVDERHHSAVARDHFVGTVLVDFFPIELSVIGLRVVLG